MWHLFSLYVLLCWVGLYYYYWRSGIDITAFDVSSICFALACCFIVKFVGFLLTLAIVLVFLIVTTPLNKKIVIVGQKKDTST